MRRRRQRRKRIQMAILTLVVFLLIIGLIFLARHLLAKKGYIGDGNETVETGGQPVEQESQEVLAQRAEEERQQRRQELMEQAVYLEATYDYDGAIAALNQIEGAAEDSEIQSLITQYQATKDACVPVNMEEVTHIFYHSLVVDPVRCFANQDTNPQAVGNNQWMTTVDEFNKITQEMYDRGYVMVSIHDLYNETTDENGNTVYEPATILLPEGKKAFVLSLDDLCYYHSYDNYGYAAKLILDENGKVTNEYYDADGNLLIGPYDVVPLMDQFVEEHPDASYRGAKGIIALTGYNGILGYRTDATYADINNPDLSADKRKWLENHPDFNLEEERAEAKKVADAMRAEGWEFASHTWGHLRVGDASLDRIKADTEKWMANVSPLVGGTDTIIFAHGQDLELWGTYDQANPKFQYLKENGFNIYCNVDSNQYRLWFGGNHIRMGRRNLDGYRIYYNAIGEQNNISDLFDAAKIIDPLRPPVPQL